MSENIQNISWPGWEAVRIIGRGGFGNVYEIRRDLFGVEEKAALKVITIPQSPSDLNELYNDGHDDTTITAIFEEHMKSIVAEYKLMKELSNCPNVVSCDDIRCIQHDNGLGWDIFIKMEQLTPLTNMLSQPIADETVVLVAKDICNALEACNKHNIVHRDIKPQNILLSSDGVYKLGDFGIAKTMEKTMGATKIGTGKFMAPEVWNNQPYGHGADVYSLGLVMYWMLNERRVPFAPLPPAASSYDEEEKAQKRRFSGEPLPPPVHGSEALKQIVLKACAFDPKVRYHSAAELREALEELINPPVPLPKPVRIRFMNGEQILQEKEYQPGDQIVPPNTVQKTEGDGKRWRFCGWEPELPEIAVASGDYRAVYEEIKKPEPPEKHLEMKETPEDKKTRKLLPILIGAVAAVALVVGACFAIPALRDKSAAPAVTPSLEQEQQEQSKEETENTEPPAEEEPPTNQGTYLNQSPYLGIWANTDEAPSDPLDVAKTYYICLFTDETRNVIIRFRHRNMDVGSWYVDEGGFLQAEFTEFFFNNPVEGWREQDADYKEMYRYAEYGSTDGFSSIFHSDRMAAQLYTAEGKTENLTFKRAEWYDAYMTCREHIEAYYTLGSKIWMTQYDINTGCATAASMLYGLQRVLCEDLCSILPDSANQLQQQQLQWEQERESTLEKITGGSNRRMNVALKDMDLSEKRFESLIELHPDSDYVRPVISDKAMGEILPQSDDQKLTEADLDNLSWADLCFARNEIFARHGWIFCVPEIELHFAACVDSWYEPQLVIDPILAEQMLSETERFNVYFIAGYESQYYNGFCYS